ncbi:hypothetical protein B0E53_02826 [Micromonospora sp. MH33]|nr:hypothetical protein B0E53_02826 [Micromonospora sp. MH33]
MGSSSMARRWAAAGSSQVGSRTPRRTVGSAPVDATDGATETRASSQTAAAVSAMLQPNGGLSSTAIAAPAPTTAPRIAQMPTAHTGSTVPPSSAARAGCMQSGATTVAPSALTPAMESSSVVPAGEVSRRARRSVRTAPATVATAANQPTQASWAGHRLTEPSTNAPSRRTTPKPYAMPSWPAPASTLTPSAVSSSLPHVRKAMSGTLRPGAPDRHLATRGAASRGRRGYFSSTSRARYVVSPTLVSMCTAPGSR